MDIYYGFNLNFPYQVVSAKVNNRSEGLNFRVYNNKDVEFLDVRDQSGMRTYVRSLCFVLFKAVTELFPDGKLFVEHPVSKGYFCNLRIGRPIELEDVTRIKQRMQEIIAENISYHRIECHTAEAVRVFSERGMNDKVRLLETSGSLYTYYYTLGDTIDYYYGNLLPSTGYLKLFDIVKYYDGLLLRIPSRENPNVLEDVVKQEKMLDVFKEYLNWSYIMGLNNAGDFNLACEEGHATDLINVAEALQEKKILIEFISKKSAENFYRMLTDIVDCEVLFMSGDSSIWERQNTIEKLSQLKSVILVATQVIEAGVDIDMDIGYKDCSKLDSEEQFMGRINRSCKKDGIVYFFNLDSARAVYKDGDIRIDEDFTVLKPDMQKILRTKDFANYYEEILKIEKRKKKNENKDNLERFFKKDVGQLDFPKVSEKMRLIDDQREMINVFLSRTLKLADGEEVRGDDVWQEYETLLHAQEMDYSEQRVKLHGVKCKMKLFVYQIEKGNTFSWDEYEQIGNMYFIKDGDVYFENGVLNREKLETGGELFF